MIDAITVITPRTNFQLNPLFKAQEAKNGAINAPTAKNVCNILSGAVPSSLTSLTIVLLKLLTLPLPIPVKKNGINKKAGELETIIVKNPSTVIDDNSIIALFLPK